MTRRTFFTYFTTALAGFSAVLAWPRKKPIQMDALHRSWYKITPWRYMTLMPDGKMRLYNNPKRAIRHLVAGHRCFRVDEATCRLVELLPPRNDLPPWLMNRSLHLPKQV